LQPELAIEDRHDFPLERAIEVAPGEIASRRAKSSGAVTAEIIQMTQRNRSDVRFRAPAPVLIIVEEGVRVAGETSVEGLPRSSLRNLRRKLTFVPAGHEYHEWQQPSSLARAVYFSFDPAELLPDVDQNHLEVLQVPRLFFEDPALWETALKISRLLDDPQEDSHLHFEALGIIIAHEFIRSAGGQQAKPRTCGGLASWQQRTTLKFIEDNLAEQISLKDLAENVRLSPYHFCRAFKQSFGIPPHRYHTFRRIERAKGLLATPHLSVTAIGMTIGFSDTSSFTSAFRKATGVTPTAFRRGLL
jgi:AraC family transcriptional regulator